MFDSAAARSLRGRTVLIANPSPDVYGSDLQMVESVSAVVAAGGRVVVVLPNDGPLVKLLTERGAEVRFVDFPVLRRVNQSARAAALMTASAVASLPRLVRCIRGVRPCVVYVNTVTLPWWLLAARLARTPTLCHLHEAEGIDGRLVRWALSNTLRLAQAVIVISRSAMAVMVSGNQQLRRRAHLIYNGVPQPPDLPAGARRQKPIRAIVVGRLSPRKAPHLALEAIGRLRQRGYDVELELAGSVFPGYEWYESELTERAAQPDLAGAVTFAGYCAPIWPHLARADLMVAPSLREPFGNAVVEAQLSLRPVVATAALGHLESITHGETGLLVRPEDVEGMLEAIRSVIDDADLAAGLAHRARANALARFSTDRYGEQIVGLVDDLSRRAHRRGTPADVAQL